MTENRETFIYDVILKRNDGCSRSDVCIYYDEDKANALNEMAKYVNKNGFSITEKDGRFSIADVILRNRKPTLTATVGMRIRGFGLSNLSGVRSRKKLVVSEAKNGK